MSRNPWTEALKVSAQLERRKTQPRATAKGRKYRGAIASQVGPSGDRWEWSTTTPNTPGEKEPPVHHGEADAGSASQPADRAGLDSLVSLGDVSSPSAPEGAQGTRDALPPGAPR